MARQFSLKPVCASICAALAIAGIPLAAQAQQVSPESFVDAEFKTSRALELIRAQYAYSWGYTGKGITIAIVDSGLDINHPEFSGRVSPFMANYVVGYGPTDVYSDLEDDDHGTHVAGLAAAERNGLGMHGVAYNATVLPLRVEGYGQIDNAFAQAIKAGAKVLNGSYGPDVFVPLMIDDPDNPGEEIANDGYAVLGFQPVKPDIESDYIRLKKAAENDIVMVFAAGNDREDQPGNYTAMPSGSGMLPLITPANTSLAGGSNPLYRFLDTREDFDFNDADALMFLDEADASDPERQKSESWDFSDLKGALIASVATDPQGIIASYSNWCGAAAAWCIAAPGGLESNPLESTLPYSKYGPMWGTSMSSPVVAGAAAVLREAFPYMTARQIIEVMLTTADRTTLPEWSNFETYGRGMLDLGMAINGPIVFGEPFGGSPFESIFPSDFKVDTQGHDSAWRNNISGTGGMAKAGAGTLLMTGQNTYLGATDITGGRLVVNGSIASSSLLVVGKDAALGGSGIVGKTDMYGRMAPGNSVGTLTVAGDYTQLPGSVFEVELGADASADKLVVAGKADIQGGMIDVQGLRASHVGRQFSFMEAGSWGAQAFDNLNIDWAFVDLDTTFVGNSASLSVQRNDTSFVSVAQSDNQRAVAQAVDSQGVSGVAFNDIVVLRDVAMAPGLFDLLSGEIYASTQSALFDTGGILRQTVLARTRQAGQQLGAQNGLETRGSASGPKVQSVSGGSHAIWGQALGSWGHFGGTGDVRKLDRSTGGLVFGGDMAVSQNTHAGLALGFTDSTFKGADTGRVNTDGYHLMAYVGSQRGPWALRGGLAQSWYSVDTRRSLGYADWGTAGSSARAQSTQLFAEAGYGMDAGQFRLEPYVGLAQAWLRQAGLAESGSPVGLQADGTRDAVTFSTLGLRAGLALDQGGVGSLQATVGLGWRHAFGDVDASRNLRFATGNSYTVVGTPLAKNAMVAELGIDWAVSNTSHVSLGYTGQIAGRAQDHGVQARASWAF